MATKAFERYVNSKDNQTYQTPPFPSNLFERYVNSKDNQTGNLGFCQDPVFERYVNSKDNQTVWWILVVNSSLRDM